jgi:hypothetical protein
MFPNVIYMVIFNIIIFDIYIYIYIYSAKHKDRVFTLEPNIKTERLCSDCQTQNGAIPYSESGIEPFRPNRL